MTPITNQDRSLKLSRAGQLIHSIATLSILTLSAAPAMAQGPGWTANSTVVKLVVTAT